MPLLLLLLLRFFVMPPLMCECDLGEASIRVGDVGEAEGRRCEGAPVEDVVVVVEMAVAVDTVVPGCLRFCPLLNLLAFSSFWGNESSMSAIWIEETVVGVICNGRMVGGCWVGANGTCVCVCVCVCVCANGVGRKNE
jgi:hypothetical protein